MKLRFILSPGFPLFIQAAWILASPSINAAPVVWNNTNGNNNWSTTSNWDTNNEPDSADDLTFPTGLAATITTTTTELALSLSFEDNYTLSGGTLELSSGNSINVADAVTATIDNRLSTSGDLTKSGNGTLVLGGNNTSLAGTVISAGKIRVTNTNALGSSGSSTTVYGAASLEIGNVTLNRSITLNDGATLTGTGNAASSDVITIDAAASAVTLGTDSASDVFTLSNAANELTGGSASTVITLSGPGTVRLNDANNLSASWNLPTGSLELGDAAALGAGASSLTLSGGTLSGRANAGTHFSGPAANLLLTASSSILSDRSSGGSGLTHTFGTLSMGAQTLTVAPGSNPTSGTAEIILGDLTLTGNPNLAVNDNGAVNGRLTTGSLLGGGARAITKTGSGDLAVIGGATDLPTGSTITASGGGSVEMHFANLGSDSSVAVSTAQNPFGSATINITDGALLLRANGSNTTAPQTYQINSAITLGGNITLDPDQRSGSNSNKTFELPGLTLAPDTVMSMSGGNTHGILLTNALTLQGNTTLKGSDTAGKDGLLTLAGGISGSPVTALTVNGGASPMNLTINAAGTYGGGTIMSGSVVTLNAANALGTGQLTMTGGTLIVNANNAIGGGTVTLGDTSGSADVTARFDSGLTITNPLTARAGSSGILTLDSPYGGVIWNGDLSLQRTTTLNNGNPFFQSSFAGIVSGSGDLLKTGMGEIAFSNPANSFTGNVTVTAGTLSLTSNGALGNPANKITLNGYTSALKIDATLTISSTIAFSNTPIGINVTNGNELTVTQPLSGGGSFYKYGAGAMTIAPGVDSSSRGGAISGISGGILRVQGVKNLSNAGIITLNGAAGTIEFLRDSDSSFLHPVTANGTGTLHVDRAVNGSGNNGRHTLGALSMNTGKLTVTGDHGYGLSVAATTTTGSSTITNDAPGELRIASLAANSSGGSPNMTFDGSGNTRITGSVNTVQTNYGILKKGPGTLRLGSGISGFARVSVGDGTLDLNNLTYSANSMNIGGATSTLGARILTGSGGMLELGGMLTFDSAHSPPGAVITGNVALGSATRNLLIQDSPNAPADLTIDGPVSGSSGAAIAKTGNGTLRLSGTGNTQPGPVSTSAGILELAKSSGDAIGTGGLDVTGGSTRLAASEQINNAASISINSYDEAFLELKDFTETVGPLSLTQTDVNDYTAVKTGATGTLVLNGNLTFHNDIDSPSNDARNVLITGTGTETTPAHDGTLDLGGTLRTIRVDTSTVGANEPLANATIETRVINGGILKTGPRTLYLTNPSNTFAGGLQIAEGTVVSGGGSSLGTSPVVFSNTGSTSASLDFGTATGTISGNYTIGGSGSGDVTITYSAPAPEMLELSGNFDLQRNLRFDVTNGSTDNGDSALLDITGTIDDGAGTRDLAKIGNGTLKLSAANTYSGATTVLAGILAISADNALGDGTAAVTLNGGCLSASSSFTTSRNVVLGANGGGILGQTSQTLELAGDLAWSGSLSSFHNTGTTILSGTTSGTGGNLSLGEPIAYAPAGNDHFGEYHVLSLRGASALPTGNLRISHHAVLELGNSDFTRPLGTGPGAVQLETAIGGGWAAHGADRNVNIGGSGATLIWGQAAPAFLAKSGVVGSLVLGSPSATHTVVFQNPLELDNGGPTSIRIIETRDGSALTDARLAGNLSLSSSATNGLLSFSGDGTVEISGNISGNLSLSQDGPGTSILSGNNNFLGDLILSSGTVVIASDDSLGQLTSLYLDPGSILDASAMTVPVSLTETDAISVHGTLVGDLDVSDSLYGSGFIDGNLTVLEGTVYPDFDSLFRIGGDFTLSSQGTINFEIDGDVPQSEFTRIRVTGSVNLSGDLEINPLTADIPPGASGTLVLILNDGSDPINGTFANYDEGALIPLPNDPYQRSLQITYLANGDGGPTGNDFGVTIVGEGGSTFDIWIYNSFTNPADRTKDANPDHDTLNNLGEFALNGDPASGVTSGKVVGKIASVGGEDVFTLTIPVRSGSIPDPADPAGGELILTNTEDLLTYRLQASDDLISFGLDVSEITGPDATTIQSGLPLLDSDWGYRSFRSPAAVSSTSAGFMRVRISE